MTQQFVEDNSQYFGHQNEISIEYSREVDFQSNAMLQSEKSAAYGAQDPKKAQRKPKKVSAGKVGDKDEIELGLEEGIVFGVKSPAQQVTLEQKQAIMFINERLKIPKIDFEVRIVFPKRF